MRALSEEPLFIFEMANNHMGSVEHGLRIVREIHSEAKAFQSRFQLAFKLQYRHLDTFLHPDFRDRDDIKYVKRFRETRLEESEFRRLLAEMEQLGFLTVCTPFDERSVDLIEEHKIAVIKIASCSLTDWPLLERIAQTTKPVIASTAGAALEDIDRVVSFFQHRQKNLSVMHCVAEYPTAADGLQLNQIDLLKKRYPGIRIGFSTHEDPELMTSVQLAIAKGATIFEKHVGVPTETAPLNPYSASPKQVLGWLNSAGEALRMCGVEDRRAPFAAQEIASLQGLRRGVFAARAIRAGETISASDGDILLAIPTVPGQVTANDLSKYMKFQATRDIAAHQPVLFSQTRQFDQRDKVYYIVKRINAMIQEAGVVVPGQAEFELSHHFGLGRYEETGAAILSLVNREYCKKLIVLLPGQSHPEHYHKLKEETFLVLHGDISIDLNGTRRECASGNILVVERGVRHSFRTRNGVIMEEISSTHHRGDSYYTDPSIEPVERRKTAIAYWLGSYERPVEHRAVA